MVQCPLVIVPYRTGNKYRVPGTPCFSLFLALYYLNIVAFGESPHNLGSDDPRAFYYAEGL